MGNKRKLTKPELLEIAQGIANGRDVVEIAGTIGVDRTTLSGWMNNERFFAQVVAAMSSPDDLGPDALENLRAEDYLDGERQSARDLRRRFSLLVLQTFPAYFENERKEKEREKRAAQSRADAAARRAERREIEAEKREARAARVHEADFFNLQTLVETCKRNWRDGTAEELAKGLNTPEKREDNRRKHGLTWDCAGFGVYYEPTWSANRCAMEYAEKDGGWPEIADNPTHMRAWTEIEAAQSAKIAEEYRRNSLKRRDPRLPTTPAEAEALWRKIANGANFADIFSPAEVTGRNRKGENPR